MSGKTVPGHHPSTSPAVQPNDVEREADLFIYKYAVGGGTEEGLANHWALVIKFSDLYVTIDGLQDQSKILQGNFSTSKDQPKGTPNTLDQSHFKPSSLSDYFSQVVSAVSDPLYYYTLFGIDLPTSLSLVVEPAVNAILKGHRPVLPSIRKLKISPKKLLEIARNNPENNKKYVLTVNDCQSWAVSAASMLRPYKIG